MRSRGLGWGVGGWDGIGMGSRGLGWGVGDWDGE